MPDERVYSEQEVAAIIKRAVELTEQEGTKYQPGVTREELLKIAEEVGVPIAALEQAIRESGTVREAKGPFQLTSEHERVVEGEIDPGQFDLIIDGLKPLNRRHSQAITQVGRKLTMQTWNGVGQSSIDITSREGRTRIQVRSGALFQGLMTLYPAFIGSMIAMGSLGEKGMIGVGVAIAAALATVGGGMFAFLTRKGHQKSRELADELRDRVAQSLESQAAPSQSTAQSEEPENLQQRLGG